MAYNPLAGGLLYGKYDAAAPAPEETRFTLGRSGATYQKRYWDQVRFDAVSKIVDVAKEHGVAAPSLAVAWVLQNETVTSAIIGASRAAQLTEMLKGADLHIDQAMMDRLNEITTEFRYGDDTR